MKNLLLPLILIGLTAGCYSVEKINGKVVSVDTSVLGLSIGENPQSQVPEVKFGLTRTSYTIIPTTKDTNGIEVLPNLAIGYGVDHKLWSLHVNNELSSGGAITNRANQAVTNVYNTGTSVIK